MTIQVQIKDVYGIECVYPVCDKAKTFCKMLGQKTLTTSDIHYIKELGITIEVVQAKRVL